MDVKSPQGFLDKVKMLAHACRDGKVLSENSLHRPLQRSHSPRQLLARRVSHPAMLAKRRRPLHHPPVRSHARSQNRQAQRRHVPNASLRPAHHRNALATPKSRSRALPRATASRRRKGKCGRARPRACSRGHNGAHFGRFRARRRQPPHRQNGSRRRHRHRSRHHLLRHRPCPARRRRISNRRLPPPKASRTGKVRDGRPRSPSHRQKSSSKAT